jgi:hypothetical protein
LLIAAQSAATYSALDGAISASILMEQLMKFKTMLCQFRNVVSGGANGA